MKKEVIVRIGFNGLIRLNMFLRMEEEDYYMGLIELASCKSVWRGMDYYEHKKIISWEKTGSLSYKGQVYGSNGEVYVVEIDKEHPRKSKCNCAFADGRRVICKHMIGLLFTAEPEQAKDFMKKVEEYEAEEELRKQQHYEEVRKYVNSLSKEELREKYLETLLELEEIRERYW